MSWAEILAKDTQFHKHIDLDSIKGKKITINSPINLNLFLWLFKNNVFAAVKE